MYEIIFSSKFKSKFKYYQNNKKVLDRFKIVFEILRKGNPLPDSYKDHLLKGQLNRYNEFHLFPDILIIYLKNDKHKIITFSTIGSHSNLFD